MLMRLENIRAGDKLTLEFKPGFRHMFLQFVSGVVFLALIVYLFFGKKTYQPFLTRLNNWLKKIKSKTKESWNKEEEY